VVKITSTNGSEYDATDLPVGHVPDLGLPKFYTSHCYQIIPIYHSAYPVKAGVHLRVCGCKEEQWRFLVPMISL